jgi:hypothetical protein
MDGRTQCVWCSESDGFGGVRAARIKEEHEQKRRMIMMSRVAKYAMLMLVALSVSATMWAQGPGGPGHRGGGMGPGSFEFERLVGGFGGKVVTGAPFSATVNIETTQVLSNGTHVDQKETASIARDSAGRTRHEITLSNIGPLAASGEAAHLAFIRDPGAGKNYILNEDKKTVATMERPENGNGEGHGDMLRQRGNNANVQTTSLGTKTMDGLTVEGTRTTRTIPAGQIGNDKPIVITREEWYSQDLQMVISSTRTDPRFGTTTYQLTNINRSEPAESLFEVPAGYTEAPMRLHGGPGGPPTDEQ